MLLQSPSPAPNGTTPLNPTAGARNNAELRRIALAAQRAKFAVLGYCTAAGAMSNAPTVSAQVAAMSQAPTNTGGIAQQPPVAGVTVVPLGSTGSNPLPPTSSAPLTIAQSVVGAANLANTGCRWPSGTSFPVGTPGQSSSWGSSDAQAPAAASSVSQQSPLVDWMTANPLLAGAVSLAALFGLAYAMKGRA
jgi:hypothetical protein